MDKAKEQFISALKGNQKVFAVNLSEEKLALLAAYFEIVMAWNPRLHLVAPCSPEEFAVRHVLESLFLLQFLPQNSQLTDVGTGAGFPGLPCLIAREDLRGSLVESAPKKAVFLREAISKLNLQTRVSIVNSRFENAPAPQSGFVTCRALDKFSEKLTEIISWAQNAEQLLLFGGEKLRDEITKRGLKFDDTLLPKSEQRFVFLVSTEEINGKAV